MLFRSAPPLLPAGAVAPGRANSAATDPTRPKLQLGQESGFAPKHNPKRPTRRSWITTYSNSARPKPVQGRVEHTAGVGDLEHTRGGAGKGTALPSPRHPPPLARAPGSRGSVTEPKGVPNLRLEAGERGRAQNRGGPTPPSPSAPTPARSQQAPVRGHGQGEGGRTPSASRVARFGDRKSTRLNSSH